MSSQGTALTSRRRTVVAETPRERALRELVTREWSRHLRETATLSESPQYEMRGERE